MRRNRFLFATISLLAILLVFPIKVSAHCPLCTMAAGAAAMGASVLGVNDFVVGLFLGAFACALGLWISRTLTIKKIFFKKQYEVIAFVIFLSTILPVIPFMNRYTSVYLSFIGDYGSPLNRTYVVSVFLLGSMLGAFIMMIAPRISKKITQLLSGRHILFQNILITFVLLFVFSLLFQFVIVLGY